MTATPPQNVVPPDTQLAVGSQYVVQVNNSFVTIWTRAGVELGALSMTSPLQESTPGANDGIFPIIDSDLLVDPWLIYDKPTGHWFLSALSYNRDTNDSTVMISVSDTEDPRLTWHRFYGDRSSHVLRDQPKLAVTSNKVIVAWTEMEQQPTGWVTNGGAWAAYDKAAMLGTAEAPSGSGSKAPDRCVPNLTPARMSGLNETGFLIATVPPDALGCNGAGVPDPADGTGDNLRILRLMGGAGEMTLQSYDVRVDPYSAPANVRQQSSARVIQAGDTRILSAVWQNNTLWAAANGSCAISAGITRGCFRLFRVNVAAQPRIDADDSVANVDRDLLFPSLAVDNIDNVIAVVTEAGKERFLGVAVFGQLSRHKEWTLKTIAQAATPAQCPSTNGADPVRIGDYSGADRDPAYPDRIWISAQITSDLDASGESCSQAGLLGRVRYR